MSLQTVSVFVSSTTLDLQAERAAVRDAVQRLRETKFVGLGYFGSRDDKTRRASLEEVDRSEVYVGIIAARYGSGITEAEYRRARELGLPCFIYFKDDSAIPIDRREKDPAKAAKLDALKQELRANHIIGPDFKSPDDLAAKVTADLHRWLFDNYLTPKLRGALSGEVLRDEAQALLGAVKDLSALNRDLVSRLQGGGFDVASGEGGVAYAGRNITAISGDYVNAVVTSVNALHQLPSPPRDFTGRKEELEELMAQIEDGGVTIAGLHGMGGVGKTALALKLAERLTPLYPDAQFYLDLKGAGRQPLPVSEALAHVVRAYHPTAKLPEGEAELQSLYLSVLHGQRALLLMDNAAGREQVEPLVPPESCVLLVTSRRHFSTPGLLPMSLDTLPAADARQLLLKIAPRIGQHAEEIAQLCGYLPLALRVAASTLAERVNLSPADYVRDLSGAQRQLELVEAPLSLGYELLSPELQRLWRALAVFPGTFDTAAAAAVWGLAEDAAQDALGEFVRYSLLDWDGDTSRYSLHNLARLFANRSLSEEERRAAQQRHAEYYLGVLGAAEEHYLRGGDSMKRGLTLLDLEWRNVQEGHAWTVQHTEENEVAGALCSSYPIRGNNILDLRLDPREQIVWLRAALSAARHLKDRRAEASHLGNLGVAYGVLGDTVRAVEFLEQKLAISREIGDRHGEGVALANLGVNYKNMGEFKTAIRHIEEALDINRVLGTRRGEANNLTNLGITYAQLGEQRHALQYYGEALAVAREIGELRGEAIILHNMGSTYGDLGEWSRAAELFERGLSIFNEIGDRRGEMRSLVSLGSAREKQGETAEAIRFYQEALSRARQFGDPWTLVGSLNKLGAINERLKRYDEAASFYEEVLESARQAGDESATADALFKLGRLDLERNDPESARRRLVDSEKLYRKTSSPAVKEVSALLGNIEMFRGETLELFEMARRFFVNAGAQLTQIEGAQVFECEFAAGPLRALLPNRVYVRFIHGEEVDDAKAREIHRQVLAVDRAATTAFVVTTDRPTDSGWAQIGTFKLGAEPFYILPIERVFLGEGLTTGRELPLLQGEVEKRVSGHYDPYLVSIPVADAFSFFGREALLNGLLRQLDEGQPVGLFGLRKLGKSSVLKALHSRAPFPVANINLQSVWNDPLADLFTRVAEEWRKWLNVRYEMSWEPPTFTPQDAVRTFIAAARGLLDRIERERGRARLALLLDEIELIVPRPDGSGPNLDRYLTLMRALRGLIEDDGRLSLLVAGLNPSVSRINSWEGEQNPAFNFFQVTYLPPLAADDCVRMVSNVGGQVGLAYEPESLSRISELSGGHPYLARQLCSMLFNLRQHKEGKIQPDELPGGVSDFIYKGAAANSLDQGIWHDAGNESLWGAAGAKINQNILIELARADDPVPQSLLSEGPESDARTAALLDLGQYHFIRRVEPESYAISFGLLRRWLRKRKLGMD